MYELSNMQQSVAVFLLVKSVVAPHRCNHNHNPLCNVSKVTGKENDLKIYISLSIFVSPSAGFLFICENS